MKLIKGDMGVLKFQKDINFADEGSVSMVAVYLGTNSDYQAIFPNLMSTEKDEYYDLFFKVPQDRVTTIKSVYNKFKIENEEYYYFNKLADYEDKIKVNLDVIENFEGALANVRELAIEKLDDTHPEFFI